MKNPKEGSYGTFNCVRIRYLIYLSVCTLIALVYYTSRDPQFKFNVLPPCHPDSVVTIKSPNLTPKMVQNISDEETVVNKYLNIYNQMGRHFQTEPNSAVYFEPSLAMLEKLVANEMNSSQKAAVLSINRENWAEIQEKRPSFVARRDGGKKVQINLAVVACGDRKDEALVMLKSAIMFSQDALLHVILFSDDSTSLSLAASVLKLKWTVNALENDFTFELHLNWFPKDPNAPWEKMWAQCATQRLFFPSLLPHIDSLIYLDTDIIVLSNLTEFWLHFENQMKDSKIAGMAVNNEPTSIHGWYNVFSKVPYYGTRGLNAGVMLMNLNLMRKFEFQEKSINIHKVYREKIALADQDIVNILFHAYPEKLHVFDCSYNFNWVHCGYGEHMKCQEEGAPCFCNATFTNGVKILHGNSHTFHENLFPFMADIYAQFNKFDLLETSYSDLLKNLREAFKNRKGPCPPLTETILYRNSYDYLTSLGFAI